MRFSQRKGLAGSVIAFAVMFAASSQADTKPDIATLEAGAISVSAVPIKSFSRSGSNQTHFGKLDFRGGLVLSAPGTRNFGGWSGLVFDPDGKGFASISDSGVWMTGVLRYADGVPVAITGAKIGPLLALDGKPLKRSRDRDAESLTLVSGSARNGKAIVAYEQNSRLVRYDISPSGFSSALSILDRPKGAAAMRRNQGFEAMTMMQGGPHKGSILALSERLYDSARNHSGWLQTAAGWQTIHLTNIGDFDLTDAASLDDGTVFVLERRFRWLEGVKMRIRRFGAGELQPGKTASGEVLIEADMEYEIDNMEGLAATRSAAGEVLLTLISDDNFNHFLQRTLLLQFALKATETAKTRPQR